jgi:hypothetical protein
MIASPIPGAGEPYYLAMAKHTWAPDWCARDLLLGSLNTHYVFSYTFGLTTKWLGLTASAIAGRSVGLLLLSFSWVSLAKRLTTNPLHAVPALVLFLSLHQFQSLSGEWLVGGIEGKVPSWAFGLLAIRFALDRSWVRVGTMLGLAVSFHPVVGGWVTLAIVGGWLSNRCFGERFAQGEAGRLVAGVLLSILLAAPGLVAAAAALRPTGVPANLAEDVRDETHLQNKANYIQVFGRLKHHLDPMEFGRNSWLWYGVMVTASLALLPFAPELKSSNRLIPIVATGVIFAFISLLIGWGPRPGRDMAGYIWKAQFLKLYPFRYIDLMLPALVGIQLTAVLSKFAPQRLGLRVALTTIGGLTVVATAPTNSAAYTATNRTDWQAACSWIDANTSPQSLYVTPRESKTFKWNANRAEWINHKDMPQDAAGIVEWNRRLWAIQAWRQDAIKDDPTYSALDMYRLRQLTSADYLLTYRIGPIDLEPVYQNETYRLYKLPEAP